MSAFLKNLTEFSYRFKIGPMRSFVPDSRLVEIVEGTAGEFASPLGERGLDIGCGLGRNALYLARQGWHAVGVELAGTAVRHAQRQAREIGVDAQFVEGDVTKLGELGIGDGYTVLVDGGCYHMIPRGLRDAYANAVTEVAAPGAVLIVVGFTKGGSKRLGVTAQDLTSRLTGWRLEDAHPVPGDEMARYAGTPRLMQVLLRRGFGAPWRFQLRRDATQGRTVLHKE